MRAVLIYGVLWTCAVSTVFAKEEAKIVPEGPKINVLLQKDARSAFLEVRGGYRVVNSDTGSTLSSGSMGKRFMVHALQDGLRWGEEYPDIYQIAIVPTHSSTCIYIDGMQYKGCMSIYHVRDNLITIVNEVPIEDYLKSTLTLKYDTPMHQEALCALAIAARMDAYTRTLRRTPSGRPWDITAKEADYHGYGVTHQKNAIEYAVDSTRFMVMELPKQGQEAVNGPVSPSKAEELAQNGLDAKQILHTIFPNQELAISVDLRQIQELR